jgi:uncharacterized membrane protein YphA (DoxX/SURF4 family)
MATHTESVQLVQAAVIGGSALFAVSRARSRWIATLMRVGVGLEFLLSVGDRLGVFGPFGSPGVSSGDFGRFVAYSQAVNAFLPASFAPIRAVAATLAETTLGLALVLGVRSRSSSAVAAGVLGLFGTAMTLSSSSSGGSGTRLTRESHPSVRSAYLTDPLPT